MIMPDAANRIDWAALLRSAPFFALIAVAAALSYRYHLLLLAQRDLVEHTYKVITTLETTLVRIIDAETGQRGFVITGDAAYLAPYNRAVADIPASMAQLRLLTADSAAQLQRERRLNDRLQEKLAELRGTISARDQFGLEAARALVARDQGRTEMDAVRQVIAEMRAAETDMLASRYAEARTTERRLLTMTVVCALLSLTARAGLALLWNRKEPAC